MKGRIYKYSFMLGRGTFRIPVPEDFHLLDIQIQIDRLSMWGVVNSEVIKEIEIIVYYTGEAIEKDLVFMKTIQAPNGLVYHLFYKPFK